MEDRFYRASHDAQDLQYFRVVCNETDLHIGTRVPLEDKAAVYAEKYRKEIEQAISDNNEFLTSFSPIEMVSKSEIVSSMLNAGRLASVGPMAAVAGAVAMFVGRELAFFSPDVIVENGGDIYIRSTVERRVGVFAGQSPLSGKIAIAVDPGEWGLCTSAAFGHSVSLGRADAAIILSHDTALADAVATGMGNMVKSPKDIDKALDYARSIEGIIGAMCIMGDKVGFFGLQVVPVKG